MTLNLTDEQIRSEHAGLIHRVVMHCNDPGSVPDIELVLQQAEENDWVQLVSVIRDVIMGNREKLVTIGLDHEDSVIIESILSGLKDPCTLPDMQVDLGGVMSVSGIAGLIQASASNNLQAQMILMSAVQQMHNAGGGSVKLAERIQLLIKGDRDEFALTEELSDQEKRLVTDIITELKRFDDMA